MHIARGPSGFLYTAGYRIRDDLSTRIGVVKWSTAGKAVWTRTYNGPVAGTGVGTDVVADRTGNVIVCGFAAGTYDSDWAVVSWSPSGKLRWAWRYSGSGHGADRPREMVVDRSGNVFITGTVTVTGGLSAACTAKLSPKGKKLWLKTYRGPDLTGADSVALVRRAAGGVYAAGQAVRADGSRDAVVVRYSASGARTVLTPYHYGGPGTGVRVNDLAVTSTGVVAAVGAVAAGGLSDQILCSWKADGTPWVTYTWGTAFDDALTRVSADAYGGVATTGTMAYGGDDDTSVVTVRLPLGPGASWSYSWNGPQIATHSAGGVACSGPWVVVVGTCDSAGTGQDQFVQAWKY
jgi:hypothetical protein